MSWCLPLFLNFFAPKTIFLSIIITILEVFYINGASAVLLKETKVSEEFANFNFDNSWTSNLEEKNPVSTCGSFGKIFGGYALFGSSVELERTYFLKNIPHYSLVFSFDFIKIDDWDKEDFVSFFLDGDEYGPIKLEEALQTKEECGQTTTSGTSAEYLKEYTFTLPSHTANTLEVKIKSHLNGAATTKSWGIKNITISLKNCHPSCASCDGETSENCNKCYDNAGFKQGQPKTCACHDNFYLKFAAGDWLNSCSFSNTCAACERCHHTCDLCAGASESSCINCHLSDTYSGGKCLYPQSTFHSLNVKQIF
jgi:hypothetical protein